MTHNFKKTISLLTALMLLISLFAFTAAAEDSSDCENGKHSPGGPKQPANFSECGGGYTEDYYYCSVCRAIIDENGNMALYYESGTGKHTLGEKRPANYTECGGGHKEDYYLCPVCFHPTDENGNEISYEPGTGKHTPGEKHPADYTECSGGFKEDYYLCSVCFHPTDENGNEIPYEPGTGKHTLGEKRPANYTECGGGFKEDYYLCPVCFHSTDENGNEIPYEPGTGKHSPSEQKYPADYTECGGGYREGFYYCSVCHEAIDENGNMTFYESGTGKHTPGEKRPANYTECSGGYREDYYVCSVCALPTDENGNSAFYESGIRKHSPGEKYPVKAYTECGGGFKETVFECTVCGEICSASGESFASIYVDGNGKHTADAELHPAVYSCEYGCRLPHHLCTVCEEPCDENGNEMFYFYPSIPHKLVAVPAKAATVETSGNIEHLKCTVCGNLYLNEDDARDCLDCSSDDVTLPKLTVEDKPAQPTANPPAQITQKVEVSDVINSVPESIADKYDSVEKMAEAMLASVLEHSSFIEADEAQTQLIDVTLTALKNGVWETVTGDSFPAEGVTVLLPYPEGTDKTSHVFAVTHMICSGNRAGDIEVLPCTPEDGGIKATFHSLSPVMIVYRERLADEVIAPLPGSVKTGDESLLCVWATLLILSGAGLVLTARRKARTSKR